MNDRHRLTQNVTLAILTCLVSGPSFAGPPDPPACSSDLLYETFEQGSDGWTHDPLQIGEPAEYVSWHLASTSCEGDELGSTMFVADGNCPDTLGFERSKLLSPLVNLPVSVPIHVVFDAVSFDEGGPCLAHAPFNVDLKDVGITANGGGDWAVLNSCYPLTPEAVGSGVFVHRQHDISAFAGQAVQVLFGYNTVDADLGHTFAVDNVRIIQGDSPRRRATGRSRPRPRPRRRRGA